MKRILTALSLVLCGVSVADAEPFDKAVQRIGHQVAAAPARLANPTLRVIAGGQLINPGQAVPDAVKANASIVTRSGIVAKTLASVSFGPISGSGQTVAAYALPVEFSGFSKESAGGQPRPLEFEPVVVVLNALRFQSVSGRFEANLVIGLRNRNVPEDRSQLAEAVTLLLRSDADETSPASVVIDRLGEPMPVKLSAISPSTPFKVIAATLLDQGDAVEVPVVRPTLLIKPARGLINGLGLEKTTVHVQADKLANAQGLRISIETTQGDINPSEIALDDQGIGSAELRSAGIGTTTLSVTGAPFEAGKAVVEFGKPWSSLIAALLGAVAGWVILKERARKKTVWSVIVAIASAAFVLAGYSVGIRLAQWAPEAVVGETLVFFVAAVGAFLGIKALVRSPV